MTQWSHRDVPSETARKTGESNLGVYEDQVILLNTGQPEALHSMC